jgi:hypothetical protein
VWNDPNPQPDELFRKAMALVGAELTEAIAYWATVWLPARVIVEEAVRDCLWTPHGMWLCVR